MADIGDDVQTIKTYDAEVDMDAYQYRVVVQGTLPAQCNMPAAAGAGNILGVIWNNPESGVGQHISVVSSGIVKVEAAGVIAIQSLVDIADALGRIRQRTPAGGTAYLGTALEAAAAAGDIISVQVMIVQVNKV
jgi:hypothetical protein